MAFQPFPDGASFTVNFTSSEGGWSNVFHATAANFDAVLLQSTVNDIKLSLAAQPYIAQLSTDFALESVVAYDLRTPDGPMRTSSLTLVPGQDVNDPMSLLSACVVTLRTNTRGRSGRGRIYVTGFCENQTTDGAYNPSAVTAATNYVLDVIETLGQVGWSPVVLSRYSNGVKRPTAVGFPIMEAVVRSPIPGTQARRARRP